MTVNEVSVFWNLAGNVTWQNEIVIVCDFMVINMFLMFLAASLMMRAVVYHTCLSWLASSFHDFVVLDWRRERMCKNLRKPQEES